MAKQRVIVLVDTTGSMGKYCASVGSTLQQLFTVLDILYEGAAHVEILAYEDYCDGLRLYRSCDDEDRQKLFDFAGALKAGGGGDCPEAVKTALNKLAEKISGWDDFSGDDTVVIHYTDAPPHTQNLTGSNASNLKGEKEALKDATPGFDWFAICDHFKQLGLPVVTFLPKLSGSVPYFMRLLGDVVILPSTDPNTITKFTIGVLLQMMGQPFEGIACAVLKDDTPCQFDREDDKELGKFIKQGNSGMVTAPHIFPEHDGFRKDLQVLGARFQESEEFQDKVFEALKKLLVPESVLCLTYNSVLGNLWRMVCRRREDPRVQPLCDALSTCCQALSGDDQTQLRAWIDESYNQLEEIAEMIQAVPNPLEEGALVLDVARGELPSKEDMRSILHAPTPGLLSKVQSLLTRLLVVKQGELPTTKDAPMYLPLALKEKDLFAIVSHLILPGMMVSLRPACMLAILAYLGGHATLKARAQAFLEAKRGNWIPPIEKVEDYPEILNAEFVKLVVRVPEFLTETELILYRHLHHLLRVRKAASLKLQAQVGFTPDLKKLTPDTKRTCKRCGQSRSFTLMIGDVCGCCMYNDGEDVEHMKTRPEPEECSNMAECRTCKALYAVVCTEKLGVAPKCYFCREGKPLESVSCSLCSNRYCAPTPSDRDVKHFVCATCTTSPAEGTPPRSATLAKLVELNPRLMLCLGLQERSAEVLFDRIGLFKLWTGQQKELLQSVEPQQPEGLTLAGKPVLSVSALLEALQQQVECGRLAEYCNLCFEERALNALHTACGHCGASACGDCMQRWYGQLKPGCLYVPAEGLCPFCKRAPKAQTLRPFNRLACRLTGRSKLELRADVYYGWCASCFQIKEAMPRECATEPPALRNWQCEECQEKRLAKRLDQDEESVRAHTRQCPGCGMGTVKSYGCDHMSCPCGAHWCWRCGEAHPEDSIYEHMEEAHGDIGDFDEDGDLSD